MLDFSSPDLAEYVYMFFLENRLFGVNRAFDMSMLEYVSMVCPDEFAVFLRSKGVPETFFLK